MKSSRRSKDDTAQVILQNLSVCCPNKCVECVEHGAEWPQEEKSIAIHSSYIYNCLWRHGTGLFARQLCLSCCFFPHLMDRSLPVCSDFQWSKIWGPFIFYFFPSAALPSLLPAPSPAFDPCTELWTDRAHALDMALLMGGCWRFGCFYYLWIHFAWRLGPGGRGGGAGWGAAVQEIIVLRRCVHLLGF